MSLSSEGNASLAFDTTVLKDCGNRYGEIASDLRDMAKSLDNCLAQLEADGWTTQAGSAFYKMTKTNWEQNIKKYADMLDMLKEILQYAGDQYNSLSSLIDRTVI